MRKTVCATVSLRDLLECRTPAQQTARIEGIIAREPRGSHGFGYDPYLWLPEEGRTSAELSPEEKNARSHRGLATRAMAKLLNDIDLETT